MGAATREIVSPPHIQFIEDDEIYFRNVIAEFARADWTAHQIEIAAMLARAMADFVKEQDLLRDEGSVAFSEKGTPVANPRKSVVQMYAGTILSLRRSLSLHARGQGGEARDVGKRRDAAKEIEGDNPLEDDLLARPE